MEERVPGWTGDLQSGGDRGQSMAHFDIGFMQLNEATAEEELYKSCKKKLQKATQR